MIKVLSDKEVKEMNKSILKWVKKELGGRHGSDLYNILIALKNLTMDK